jgi:hypothetical protein
MKHGQIITEKCIQTFSLKRKHIDAHANLNENQDQLRNERERLEVNFLSVILEGVKQEIGG